MRNSKVDKYMEERFGKPDYSKTFPDMNPYSQTYGKWLTPFKHVMLWRVGDTR